jgi:hypothetical protein
MLKKKYNDSPTENESEILSIATDVKIYPVEEQEFIQQMLDNEPPDRRTIEHKRWMRVINEKMKRYNEEFGKIYTLRR